LSPNARLAAPIRKSGEPARSDHPIVADAMVRGAVPLEVRAIVRAR